MERITNQTHNKQTAIYACSRLFERASYYGLRALIVIYMISESLNMSKEEAITALGTFSIAIIISEVLGAFIGDLIIDNKKAIILGGMIQAIGSFCFCIPSSTGLYLGLALVGLGNGFYTSNILAYFGKLHLNRTQLLDAAFTIFYLAANIGAFIGIMIVGYSGENYGWNIGFVLAGILMTISAILPIFSKETIISEINYFSSTQLSQNIIKAFGFVGLVALFWSIYGIANTRTFDLDDSFRYVFNEQATSSYWSFLNSFFVFPITTILIILWTKFYYNQFLKLTIGFLFAAIAYSFLFFIPEIPTKQHLIIYLIALFFLNISEIHIAPIVHSILTQKIQPKYLAIAISLAFIPSRLLAFIIGFFDGDIIKNPLFSLIIAIVSMIGITIGLVLYNQKKKHKTP